MHTHMHTYIRMQAYIHTYIQYIIHVRTYIISRLTISELRSQQMSKLFTCSTNQKRASAVDKLPYSFGLHLKHFITKAKTKFIYVCMCCYV